MPLDPGTRLCSYEILSALGQGGMGEVYRARDSKLGRDVALKILPKAFMADSARVARFHREAHVLPSLNHPHIAQICGFDDDNCSCFLILEARGRAVDQRADIGAFGCVLFEMLTGDAPFQGDNSADVIAAILTREPAWSRLPGTTPPAVRSVLRTSLENDARDRAADFGARRRQMQDVSAVTTVPPLPRSMAVLPFTLLSEVADRQALSLGFADALITTLGNLEDVVVAWLERSADTGNPCWPFFRVDPHLDSLRSHERFQQLVSRLERESMAIPIRCL